MFLLILLDIPEQQLRKSMYPFFCVLSQATNLAVLETTAQLSRCQKNSFQKESRERRLFFLDKERGDFCSNSSLSIKTIPKVLFAYEPDGFCSFTTHPAHKKSWNIKFP